MALSIAATENGALRLLPTPPVKWTDRLLAQDFHTAFLRAFQAEAFLHLHAVEGVRGAPPSNLVTALYNKLSMAGYSERVRMMTELFRDRDDSCSLTRLVISARRDAGDIVNTSPVASTVCNGVSWIQTRSSDGRVTIAVRPARPVRDEVSTRDWTFSFGPTS
ncbi:MAG TPA: hypothetical protein VGJ39_06290 [Vicinamibacterales bacterium]|jgi:hypothetical protein